VSIDVELVIDSANEKRRLFVIITALEDAAYRATFVS